MTQQLTSLQAFKAVLKSNFSKIKRGPERIDNDEFVIEEAGTGRILDLAQDWESCFLPGQTVLMSMVFHQMPVQGSTCPSCEAACDGPQDKELVCPVCRFTFRRVKEVKETKEELTPSSAELNRAPSSLLDTTNRMDGASNPRSQSSSIVRVKREQKLHLDVNELRSFRRVHIRTFEATRNQLLGRSESHMIRLTKIIE